MDKHFKSPLSGVRFIVASLLIACSGPIHASELSVPQGRVILSISGNISTTNQDKVANFDKAMLEQLPQHTILTDTPWTDGKTTFVGPLLRDLLAMVGINGDSIKAVAINNYSVPIPVEDAEKYEVILAMQMNGKPMRIRDKGPLWVIYPWADQPELRAETFYNRSIWQLKEISVD